MSHTSTKIYTDATHGISIGDIQSVIDRDEHDIGGLAVEGAANEDINKWAKYKFIRSTSPGGLTASELEDIYYGLNITKFTSPSSLAGSYSSSEEYSYLPPRGNNHTPTEWFRILDNDEYISNAECPVESFHCVNSEATVYEGIDLTAHLYLNSSAPTGSILLSDLKPGGDKALSNYYFGVVIKNENTYRILTNNTVVGDGSVSNQDVSLALDSSLFSLGNDYTLYPVFSYNAITTISSSTSFPAGLFAVPNVSPQSFHVYPITLFVSAAITNFSMTIGAGRYDWSITAVMQVNGSTTVTGEITYRIYDGAYDQETGIIGGSVVDSGTFYYGQIAQAPSQTTVTKTSDSAIMSAIPDYLTAVISYQGSDYLPVTIASEDF